MSAFPASRPEVIGFLDARGLGAFETAAARVSIRSRARRRRGPGPLRQQRTQVAKSFRQAARECDAWRALAKTAQAKHYFCKSLGGGWWSKVDVASKLTYYVNERTGEVKQNRPL